MPQRKLKSLKNVISMNYNSPFLLTLDSFTMKCFTTITNKNRRVTKVKISLKIYIKQFMTSQGKKLISCNKFYFVHSKPSFPS